MFYLKDLDEVSLTHFFSNIFCSTFTFSALFSLSSQCELWSPVVTAVINVLPELNSNAAWSTQGRASPTDNLIILVSLQSLVRPVRAQGSRCLAEFSPRPLSPGCRRLPPSPSDKTLRRHPG